MKRSVNDFTNITADIIILGCNLPGIVVAHKLKEKFGNTINVLVLDLPKNAQTESKQNVAFHINKERRYNIDNKLHNIADNLLVKYANEFNIPLPEAIFNPEVINYNNRLSKVFQYSNGNIVACEDNYHSFGFLNIFERIELNQYQALLDEMVKELFHCKTECSVKETKRLAYYDRTTMENHLYGALMFSNSRDVMRMIVRLVCGTSADSVSLLFYLHQCYRTNGCRNHIDGANTRMREKLLGYYRKSIKYKLQKCIADITIHAKEICVIRPQSDEEVVLETIKGESNYVCSQLAMALTPDELQDICLDEELLTNESRAYLSMIPGKARKFVISYQDNFWRNEGFSGDIFSIQGPILWAIEKPKLSTEGEENYSALIGYLKEVDNSKEAVIKQLVKLYGNSAKYPTTYREMELSDVFIPRCGDYVAIRRDFRVSRVEWTALDVFGDGDVAGAMQAGHNAYVNLLHFLRPQAQTYEDVSSLKEPIILEGFPIKRWLAAVNYKNTIQTLAICSIGIFISLRLMRSIR